MLREATVSDLLEQSREFDSRKSDTTVRVEDLQFDSNGLLVPQPTPILSGDYLAASLFRQRADTAPLHSFSLTDHSFNQVLRKMLPEKTGLYGTHASSLRAMYQDVEWPRGLLVDVLREHLSRYKQYLRRGGGGVDRWFIRIFENQIRAVLAEGYLAFNNSAFLEAVEKYTQNVGYEIDNGTRIEPDRMYVKLIYTSANGLTIPWQEIQGSSYRTGIAMISDEVGQGSMRISPMIQKGKCVNTTVYLNSGFKMTHQWRRGASVGGNGQRDSRVSAGFAEAIIKEQLGNVFQASQELKNELMEAAIDKIPDPADVITSVCRSQGINMELQQEALIGSELPAGAREGTRANVMDGLSYAAHLARNQSKYETAQRLEAMSGVALADPQTLAKWTAQGRRMKDDEIVDEERVMAALYGYGNG